MKMTLPILTLLICHSIYTAEHPKEVKAYLTHLHTLLQADNTAEASKIFFIIDNHQFSPEKTEPIIRSKKDLIIKRVKSCLEGKVIVRSSNPPFLPKGTKTYFCHFKAPDRKKLGIVLYKRGDRIGFGLHETFDAKLYEESTEHKVAP